MTTHRDFALEVKRCLVDPIALCSRLGWMKGHAKQSRGVIIRCPSHGENEASCGVRVGKDGTIQVTCFSCGFKGDALSLVALAHGLAMSRDFREVLAIGAEIAGNLGLADRIKGNAPRKDRPILAPPKAETCKEREYIPTADLVELLSDAGPVRRDREVSAMLRGRSIDPETVDALSLGRAIWSRKLPKWASHTQAPWTKSGHRLIIPQWDHMGALRGVRAWRVIPGDTPKRLPPGGARGTGLVTANRIAVAMLRGGYVPRALWITEGEPDTLTAATRWAKGDAVIGIGSGSWSPEFAARIPDGMPVVICTHGDRAGDKYADYIKETMVGPLYRWRPVPDINEQAMRGELPEDPKKLTVAF